jgi:hypothetical protein
MSWTLADFDGTEWKTILLDAYYVNPFIGKSTNTGHPKKPYASPEDVFFDVSINATIVLSAGTYAFVIPSNASPTIIGDTSNKEIFIDGTNAPSVNFMTAYGRPSLHNVTIRNYATLHNNTAGGSWMNLEHCVVENIFSSLFLSRNGDAQINYCIFKNCAHIDRIASLNKCTFINTGVNSTILISKIISCHFDADCNIVTSNGIGLFDNCNVLGTIDGQPSSVYKAANSNHLQNSISSPDDDGNNDPQFNDPDNGDYTIKLTSPNRYLGADRLQAGAWGIGFGNWGADDFTVISNYQYDIPSASWQPIDPNLVGEIEGDVIDMGANYPIEKISVFAQEDDIGHRHIDTSLPYLSTNIASGNIAEGITYLVKGYDNLTYNGQIYLDGQVFEGVNGVNSYTTSGSGNVYTYIEFPDTRKVFLRWSSISAADVLTKNYQAIIRGTGLGNETPRWIQPKIRHQPK